ncbi:hypothetical protein EDD85DRAFT_797496 [Armillaria nabsnona]|nr:hypothetical protein EDD85DRAFT_797496 [Armillaria nabsnona]
MVQLYRTEGSALLMVSRSSPHSDTDSERQLRLLWNTDIVLPAIVRDPAHEVTYTLTARSIRTPGLDRITTPYIFNGPPEHPGGKVYFRGEHKRECLERYIWLVYRAAKNVLLIGVILLLAKPPGGSNAFGLLYVTVLKFDGEGHSPHRLASVLQKKLIFSLVTVVGQNRGMCSMPLFFLSGVSNVIGSPPSSATLPWIEGRKTASS